MAGRGAIGCLRSTGAKPIPTVRLTFCTTDGWNAVNGINAWLLRFLPDLRARGHDARVLLFPWSRPRLCTSLPGFRAAGLPVEIVGPRGYTEGAIRACLRHARSFKPDVFVANMVTPALHASGWLRASGIPTVGIIHNDDARDRAKVQLFAGSNPFFRLAALVTISRGLLEMTKSVPDTVRVRCIPYGVPVPEIRAIWPGKAPLRLVYHGRIVQEQKRVIETIAACVRLSRFNPAIEADFYGSGPETGAAADLLARDNADGRVRLMGHVEPGRMSDTLAAYHVAILLSDYEGLGLSILEAMAAGLVPVCLRTASGLPDLVESGRNGLFVEDRGAGFDAAILSLLHDSSRWMAMAQAARDTVVSRFSPGACVAAWEALLSELPSAPASSRRIPLPLCLELPAVNPLLADEDRRFPGVTRAIWRRVRFPGSY